MMRKHIIFLTCSILILTFRGFGQANWSEIDFTDKLKDKLLANDIFIPNDFVYKNEDGKWQSALLDQNGNQIIDTTLYLIGANCEVDNVDSHLIRFCSCHLENDSLYINIYDANPSYSETINIICLNDNFTSKYNTNYTAFFPGQEYIWETKKQKLKLSSNNFEKGRWLNGQINLNIEEFFKSDTYPLTYSRIKIRGFFKCIIE